MRIVKVRRVGNSNVVSIPREFEASGYAPGSSVLMEELPGGELRIVPTDRLRAQIKQIGQRVVTEHREALKILAEDSPETPSPPL
jgi:antitoxin component of MazEF toxin-antitoxin module